MASTAPESPATLAAGLSEPPTSPTPSSYSVDSDDAGATVADTNTEIDAPRRHPDLWFSDGSVVLCAEHVCFRVHMSQLARHSLFFRDLFSLPQPECDLRIPGKLDARSDKEATSCPLIHLQDTAEDVENLLHALYDGPNFGNNDRADFRTVSGILRLSSKYLIDRLRAMALAHLSIAWPVSLKAWDAREEVARTYELDSAGAAHGGLFYPSPIDVINLARTVNAPALLPAAFYDLSRYHYTQIFEPSEEDPLYVPHRPPTSPTAEGPAGLGAPLASDDMRRLALGKEASHLAVIALIQAMGRNPSRDSISGYPAHASTLAACQATQRKSSGRACVSAAACRKDFSELVELATQHYILDRERGCEDPLYVAEELGQLKSAEYSECQACARSLEIWAQRERERIWKLAPVWFRLDGRSLDS